MTEEELRAIVRDVIARQAGSASAASPMPPLSLKQHSSHALFVVAAGADTGGACLIEPAVRCNHCGYCQSFGH